MPATVVPQETLPRCQGGVDYGAERIVLARAPDGRMLVWRKAHKSWQSRLTGYQSVPGALELVTPASRVGDIPRTKTLYKEGGRLSVAIIRRFKAEIDDFFGVPITDGINSTTTLVVQEVAR